MGPCDRVGIRRRRGCPAGTFTASRAFRGPAGRSLPRIPMSGPAAVVVGAGAIGAAIGLRLQMDGWRVTVVDPLGPGEATSFGNAGLIATHIIHPVGTPGILWRAPRMILDSQAALTIRWRYLPRLLPWLSQFVQASRPDRVREITSALAGILATAHEEFLPLIEAAEAASLIRRQGILVAYRSERLFRSRAAQREAALRLGVRFRILDGAELRRFAPALSTEVAFGVLYPDSAHTVNPHALVLGMADAARRRGAEFLRERVVGFDFGGSGVRAVRTEGVTLPADVVAVAAGAWSGPLAEMLGCRAPLDTERGYHVTIEEPEVAPPLPVISADPQFGITPMGMGLRLAGTVEFGGLRAPPNPARHELLLRHARALLPGLRGGRRSNWMGFRPSLPDSMPVIGRAPGCSNAFLAFGHGHLGLTLAGSTASAIAACARGEGASFDLAPFSAGRFGTPR